jgi:hypothetical protein
MENAHITLMEKILVQLNHNTGRPLKGDKQDPADTTVSDIYDSQKTRRK